MPSTSRGYRYPALTDNVDVPEDIGNLAADLNADVGTVATSVTTEATARAAGDTTEATARAAADTALAAAYRPLISERSSVYSSANGTGPHVLGNNATGLLLDGMAAGVARIDPTAHAITGKTANARIVYVVANNTVSAATTATLALRRITASGGSSGAAPTPTLDATLYGSVTTATIGASALSPGEGSVFDLSTLTAGAYALVATFASGPAANSRPFISARVEIHYT